MNTEFRTKVEVVLQLAYEEAVANGSADLLSSGSIQEQAKSKGISEDELHDALEVSRRYGNIRIMPREHGSNNIYFSILPRTFDKYALAKMPDYGSIVAAVKAKIKQGQTSSKAIANAIEQHPPHWLIKQIFRLLKANGLIEVDEVLGADSDMIVTWVSPQLKHE